MPKKSFVQATTINTEIADGAAKITVSIKVKSETSEFAQGFKAQLEEVVKLEIEALSAAVGGGKQ